MLLLDDMDTRNTHNSRAATFDALSLVNESEGNPPRSFTVSLDPSVARTNLSNSSPVVTPNAVLQDQPSLAFLAADANAQKQALSSKLAASLPASS